MNLANGSSSTPIASEEELLMKRVLLTADKYIGSKKELGSNSPAPVEYSRPSGVVYFCMKNAWRPEPTLSKLENAAPDTWENIRYRLEVFMGLHNCSTKKSSSFLGAVMFDDFEQPKTFQDAKNYRVLRDCDVLDDHCVLILTHRPSKGKLGHYVPLALLPEWGSWIETETRKMHRGTGKSTVSVNKRDFYTSTHTWGPHGWFPRSQSHASNYEQVPPPFWHCPRCDVSGDHWEQQCEGVERTCKRKLRFIHGIPRSNLRLVSSDSTEGCTALLTDREGNLYVEANKTQFPDERKNLPEKIPNNAGDFRKPQTKWRVNSKRKGYP
jgi:hypothetical protein